MTIILPLFIIFLISFLWAFISLNRELSVPDEVKDIKITKRKKIFGVILFLKKKIIHYTSESS
jgi:hypothetical protein